jgi:hypothetical protein
MQYWAQDVFKVKSLEALLLLKTSITFVCDVIHY